jgi:hypothetical protein
MDELSRAYYEVVFELGFIKKKGNEFQDFFAEIMEKSHPADFQRVRPWGTSGDRKNDGYLRSERNLFQVYAPNELSSSSAIDKIDEDFKGALPFWGQHFRNWTFVHNSRQGLGPDVLKKLLDLKKANPKIKIKHWGFEELRNKVFSLQDQEIEALLGPAPSRKDITKLAFEDLRIVLVGIGQQYPLVDSEIRPVPAGKLSANALSVNVEILIRTGMAKSDLVKRFFDDWHDPTLGDRVAERFKEEYTALKKNNVLPDNIFSKLLVFAGGGERGTPTHEVAVLAVLAHLFEECDIFERPPGT